jgi:hypothetical protein
MRTLFPNLVGEVEETDPVDRARIMYPDLGGVKREPIKPRPEGQADPLSNQAAGEKLYPAKNPRLANVDDSGHVASLIRDRQGNILHQGPGTSSYTDIVTMIQAHSDNLRNADLSEVNFGEKEMKGAKMQGADLSKAQAHGYWAYSDLREANLSDTSLTGADLRFSDLRGACFENCDLAGADLSHAKYNFTDLKKAKNWERAIGLKM